MRRGEEWIYYYCVVLGDVLYIYTQKKNRYDTRLKQFYFIFLCAVSELTFLMDDKRIGIGKRELAVCNEFSV
jgi:hypothetical protein